MQYAECVLLKLDLHFQPMVGASFSKECTKPPSLLIGSIIPKNIEGNRDMMN